MNGKAGRRKTKRAKAEREAGDPAARAVGAAAREREEAREAAVDTAAEDTAAESADEKKPGEGITPFGSLAAVIGGFVALMLLAFSYGSALQALAPDHLPSDEGSQPTTTGLGLMLAGMLPNGVLAGFVTGRLAGVAPIIHAAVLASFVGYQNLVTSDEARGLPFWFALGRAFLPSFGIVLGGVIAREVARRRDRAKQRASSAA